MKNGQFEVRRYGNHDDFPVNYLVLVHHQLSYLIQFYTI